MNKSLERLHQLIEKNAELLHRSGQSHDALREAAQQELTRIGTSLAAIPAGEAITDPAIGETYQKRMIERASLQRLLAA